MQRAGIWLRRWRWWLPIVIVAMGFIWIDHVLTEPAVGHTETAHLPLHAQTPAASATPPAAQTSNQYYSLNLPPGYTLQPPQQPAGLLLSQTILKPGSLGTLIINIGVGNLPGGDLSANSSYSLRANDSSTYRPSRLDGVQTFTRVDGANGEVVAFWPHGDVLATISVTDGVGNSGGGDTAGDTDTLQTLLQAWQWR